MSGTIEAPPTMVKGRKATTHWASLDRLRALGDVTVLDLILHPEAIWQIANEVAETGWYTIKNITPSGYFLWAFWAIEADDLDAINRFLANDFIVTHAASDPAWFKLCALRMTQNAADPIRPARFRSNIA